MYKPYVTATREVFFIAAEIQSVPPSRDICSHSQVHPHSHRTSKKEVGTGGVGAWQAVGVIGYIPGYIFSTKQISLSCCHSVVAVLEYPFIYLPVLEYTFVMAEPAAECSSVFEVKHHHHGRMRCVLATYLPTL